MELIESKELPITQDDLYQLYNTIENLSKSLKTLKNEYDKRFQKRLEAEEIFKTAFDFNSKRLDSDLRNMSSYERVDTLIKINELLKS